MRRQPLDGAEAHLIYNALKSSFCLVTTNCWRRRCWRLGTPKPCWRRCTPRARPASYRCTCIRPDTPEGRQPQECFGTCSSWQSGWRDVCNGAWCPACCSIRERRAAAHLLSEPSGVWCCQHHDYGRLQSDVDDSYPGARADIERLRAEQRLYAIHNHDLREFVLYPR